MAIKRTFVSPLVNEYGDEFSAAIVGIMETELNTSSNRKASEIDGEMVRKSGVTGGVFRVNYFSDGPKRDLGRPDRPLRRKDSDGILTEWFVIDAEQPAVQEILASNLSDDDKEENIARVEFLRQFR